MKILRYAEAEHQLINMLKLKLELDEERIITLLRSGPKWDPARVSLNKSRLKGVVKELYVNSRAGKIMLILNFSFLLLKHHPNTIATCDARGIIYKIARLYAAVFNKEIWLVDDGLYLVTNLEKLLKQKINIHTVLPNLVGSSKCQIIQTDPLYQFHQNLEQQRAIILGQPLVELGIMDQKSYTKLLAGIKNQLGQIPIVYYSHRAEAEIPKNKEIKGLEIIQHCGPIEERFCRDGINGTIILSFFSTTMVHLARSGVTGLWLVEIPDEFIESGKERSRIKRIQSYLFRIGLQRMAL